MEKFWKKREKKIWGSREERKGVREYGLVRNSGGMLSIVSCSVSLAACSGEHVSNCVCGHPCFS